MTKRHRQDPILLTHFPSVRQPLRDALQDLAAAGAEITLTGSGHYRARHPNLTRDAILASTPRRPEIEAKRVRTILRRILQ